MSQGQLYASLCHFEPNANRMANRVQDGNIIKHASREIKTETHILKRELDKELSSKVNKRLKSNEQKLNNIRTALKDLETDNEYLYTDGNSRLAELERALEELHQLITQMAAIRSSGLAVTEQCKEIQDKINITSTKISNSMTSLNELINTKHGETKHIAKDLKKLKKEMNKQHTSDRTEVSALEKRLDEELASLEKSLHKELKHAIAAAKESKCCCTLL